jgi:site-specific DNA-methyltransferase (adenine-specific)
MVNFPLPRLDKDEKLYEMLLPYCRLNYGEIWNDPIKKHTVGCLDCTDEKLLNEFAGRKKFTLAVHDPPYNMVAFRKTDSQKFVNWCEEWISLSYKLLKENAALYVWLGADQKNHLEPFAEFIMMMKHSGFDSRSFITMRNQRGYGTQKNWMSIRQELLYYSKGVPIFNTQSVYTNIPKVVKGYYKQVNGKKTENLERSKSDKIRAGNVWVDIQQVFHLMEENINGCFAQKPIASIERIIKVSSNPKDRVIDFFSHSGTTLLACERLNRKCHTVDIDPIYCEISIRRLEAYRKKGINGWQNSNPFEKEILANKKIKSYLKNEYGIEYKK